MSAIRNQQIKRRHAARLAAGENISRARRLMTEDTEDNRQLMLELCAVYAACHQAFLEAVNLPGK